MKAFSYMLKCVSVCISTCVADTNTKKIFRFFALFVCVRSHAGSQTQKRTAIHTYTTKSKEGNRVRERERERKSKIMHIKSNINIPTLLLL